MNIERVRNAVVNRTYKTLNARRGWKTNRKIVVIESDDWGSIRMPDRRAYENSLKSGIRVDKSHYCKYDTLASISDFDALFSMLLTHKDSNGKHPVITANTIVANPDFGKIKERYFEEYHFETFLTTIKRYPSRNFDSWRNGMNESLFYPQLHGREHLNIERWLKALKNGSREINFAFEEGYFGIGKTISNEGNPSFMAALDYDNEAGKINALASIDQATDIFTDVFGFPSKSFIAPNYYWDENVEVVLSRKGIEYLQGSFIQKTPMDGNKYHYLGQRNKFGQQYLIRNVVFEPSAKEDKNWVADALKEISFAFKHGKPAIISMHRVNFIGSIFEYNRTRCLNLLDELLREVTELWPNVEFMHSESLGDLIEEKLNK